MVVGYFSDESDEQLLSRGRESRGRPFEMRAKPDAAAHTFLHSQRGGSGRRVGLNSQNNRKQHHHHHQNHHHHLNQEQTEQCLNGTGNAGDVGGEGGGGGGFGGSQHIPSPHLPLPNHHRHHHLQEDSESCEECESEAMRSSLDRRMRILETRLGRLETKLMGELKVITSLLTSTRHHKPRNQAAITDDHLHVYGENGGNLLTAMATESSRYSKIANSVNGLLTAAGTESVSLMGRTGSDNGGGFYTIDDVRGASELRSTPLTSPAPPFSDDEDGEELRASCISIPMTTQDTSSHQLLNNATPGVEGASLNLLTHHSTLTNSASLSSRHSIHRQQQPRVGNLTGRTTIPTATNEEEQQPHSPASAAIVTDAQIGEEAGVGRREDDVTAISQFNSTAAAARGHHLPNSQAGGVLGVDSGPELMLTSSSSTSPRPALLNTSI
ncbi:uncharacterized protein LOC142350606 [Convolutriloba macropyga]|uniref:uncharacterized protein LOC142350606 n=1 Tax=Convolutriloba macropyga TaxID=536237 RepID=UPI003F520099